MINKALLDLIVEGRQRRTAAVSRVLVLDGFHKSDLPEREDMVQAARQRTSDRHYPGNDDAPGAPPKGARGK
jgi:hypothetical protein